MSDVLAHSVQNLSKIYEINTTHAGQVAWLSSLLFKKLEKLHKLPESYKNILTTAAYLHDIGMYVDYYKHHKHGFYLILNSHLDGLDLREKILCAFLVGMHRSTELKEDIRKYIEFITEADIEAVKKLSLLISIADKLDVGENGNVISVECKISQKDVSIFIKTKEQEGFGIEAALMYDKAFEKAFNKTLKIL